MKLIGDKIALESRYEVSQMRDAIEGYLKSGQADSYLQEDLKMIKDKLDVLYMCW